MNFIKTVEHKLIHKNRTCFIKNYPSIRNNIIFKYL